MSATADPFVIEARGIVVETIRMHLGRGLQKQEAWYAAARDLCLTPRRVRSYWHNEVTAVIAREWAQIKERQRIVHEAELRQLDARAAILRARLQENRAA